MDIRCKCFEGLASVARRPRLVPGNVPDCNFQAILQGIAWHREDGAEWTDETVPFWKEIMDSDAKRVWGRKWDGMLDAELAGIERGIEEARRELLARFDAAAEGLLREVLAGQRQVRERLAEQIEMAKQMVLFELQL